MVSRWTRIAALAVLLAAFGWLYSSIWGNPLVILTMKGRALEYLAERYPSEPFLPTKTTYDFLNKRYVTRVEARTDRPVVFRVVFGRTLQGHDDYRERRREAELEEQLTPVVKETMPTARVGSSVVLPDASSSGVVSVSVSWIEQGVSPEGFVAAVMEMLPNLQSSGLSVDEYHFWCDVAEDRALALNLTPEQMGLSRNDLLPLVGKPGKW